MDTINQAINDRYSVRKFLKTSISNEDKMKIQTQIEKINQISNLNIQVRYDEPKAFDTFKSYGSFENANNYILMVGTDDNNLNEKAGYYGEMLVLYLTSIGIGTCFVVASYSKRKVSVDLAKNEKLAIVIAIGYAGDGNRRHIHKKTTTDVSNLNNESPLWFKAGVEAALKAPTAINQQRFRLTLLSDGKVEAKALFGFYSDIDLGIVKCNFEFGAGKENFVWA